MNRTLLAEYQSENSTYFEYIDGWTCQTNGNEIPLKHAAYILMDYYKNTIKSEIEKIKRNFSISELEELISGGQSLETPKEGGVIVSIIEDHGKIYIRTSKEIKKIREITSE
ncbi:MAG TPA: hypothetical protein QGG70_03130 [Candidatus Pacearchaeota archaeon]|jgi:hypothetical protein|nr:hypothetical protein [Candidatus Pacearchaeota archaeon]|tara:strand:- start:358 stop:693 length:336 start_codon:yes stop_codon:yes gene_type:complete